MDKEILLKKSYKYCKEKLGKSKIKKENIKLKIYSSRKLFFLNKLILKFHWPFCRYNYNKIKEYFYNKEFVGFVDLKNRFWEINILSPEAFEKESKFDKYYFYNVLHHEMAHIFLKERMHDKEEDICYFIAHQRRFGHEKYFKRGKKWFKSLKL